MYVKWHKKNNHLVYVSHFSHQNIGLAKETVVHAVSTSKHRWIIGIPMEFSCKSHASQNAESSIQNV